MMYFNEHDKKLNDIYTRLEDLKEGKRILERAMHNNFYNKEIYQRLFNKLYKINAQIKQTKKELEEEKKANEKSR